MAERQAQVAALNMMGHCQSYIAVPFFWTERLSSIGRRFSNSLLKNLEIGSLLVFLPWDLGGRDVVSGR
jgi:hypothetical protein